MFWARTAALGGLAGLKLKYACAVSLFQYILDSEPLMDNQEAAEANMQILGEEGSSQGNT